MNIALDIDGTISDQPEFFSALSSGFRTAGHRIYVLTQSRISNLRFRRAEMDVRRAELIREDELRTTLKPTDDEADFPAKTTIAVPEVIRVLTQRGSLEM